MLEKLQPYIDSGLVKVGQHPTLDLYIANYTQTCQFTKAWDEITLMCRGLIFNSKGEIIAQPFPKFFNLEELERSGQKLPNGRCDVYEKLDGSLGILFSYQGEIILATRGSFVSDQAVRGMEILKAKHGLRWFWDQYTYLFEIIYPENRIVLSYDNLEDLVLLGIIDKQGNDFMLKHMEGAYPGPYALHLGQHRLQDIDRMRPYLTAKTEGFVLVWPDGFRVKVKGDDYVRLHRIMTGVTERRVWEKRSQKYWFSEVDFEEWLQDVPEEFEAWIRKTAVDLFNEFTVIEKEVMAEYARVYEIIHGFPYYSDMKVPIDSKENMKQFAELIKTHHHKDVLFRFNAGKPDWWELIWKKLRPGHVLPFLADEAE